MAAVRIHQLPPRANGRPAAIHTDDGLQALAEAHTLVEQHEERRWETAIYCLGGVLRLR
jgi:hypothetical protein